VVAAHSKISNLARHKDKYVTVAQLAEYWQVSRKQIYKHIDAGTLEAIRLGPRLYRIQTAGALDFEERAQIGSSRGHRAAKIESRDR
jgi:excisionase family DNA binding protein